MNIPKEKLISDKVRADAVRLRITAVGMQIEACKALCDSAELEIRYKDRVIARKLLRQLKHHAQTIVRHLNDPHHLAPDEAVRFRADMAEVETRLRKMESHLRGVGVR